MPIDRPLPFRLKIPGADDIDFHGVSSISYMVHGLLHLHDDVLAFEWTATRHREIVSLTHVKEEVDDLRISRGDRDLARAMGVAIVP